MPNRPGPSHPNATRRRMRVLTVTVWTFAVLEAIAIGLAVWAL